MLSVEMFEGDINILWNVIF